MSYLLDVLSNVMGLMYVIAGVGAGIAFRLIFNPQHQPRKGA